MFKNNLILCLVIALSIFAQISYVQAEQVTIQGAVESVADDGSFVVVNGEKIMISEEVADYMDMQDGDMVEIITEETENGKVAVDYNYI